MFFFFFRRYCNFVSDINGQHSRSKHHFFCTHFIYMLKKKIYKYLNFLLNIGMLFFSYFLSILLLYYHSFNYWLRKEDKHFLRLSLIIVIAVVLVVVWILMIVTALTMQVITDIGVYVKKKKKKAVNVDDNSFRRFKFKNSNFDFLKFWSKWITVGKKVSILVVPFFFFKFRKREDNYIFFYFFRLFFFYMSYHASFASLRGLSSTILFTLSCCFFIAHLYIYSSIRCIFVILGRIS